jgi:hypothetical protein
LEQKEQVHRVTAAGRCATVNWVAPQWQLPFIVIDMALPTLSVAGPSNTNATHLATALDQHQ